VLFEGADDEPDVRTYVISDFGADDESDAKPDVRTHIISDFGADGRTHGRTHPGADGRTHSSDASSGTSSDGMPSGRVHICPDILRMQWQNGVMAN